MSGDGGPVPDTDLDYFEIAKKLTRAHSEALGDVYLKNTELEIALEVVRALVDQIIHMAHVTHTAHHHNQSERWVECRWSLCKDAVRLLASLPGGGCAHDWGPWQDATGDSTGSWRDARNNVIRSGMFRVCSKCSRAEAQA